MDTPWWRQRVEADRVLKAQCEKAAAYNEAIDAELRAQAAGGSAGDEGKKDGGKDAA